MPLRGEMKNDGVYREMLELQAMMQVAGNAIESKRVFTPPKKEAVDVAADAMIIFAILGAA